MLRKARIILAGVSFTLITLLFLDFTGTVQTYFSWLAKMQFVPALLAHNAIVIAALILLTLLFGRVYCSVICPLGILQDIFGWFGKKAKKNRYSFSPAKKVLRYASLAIFVLLIITGFATIAQLIAPYSAYGKIAGALIAPIYQWINNLLAAWSEHSGNFTFYKVDVYMKGLSVVIVSIITLVGLAILAWRNGRTWCNTICPVGTILGFVSKFSLFKVMIDTTKCNSCGLCARNCKASCINSKEHKIDHSRCVVCMDCLGKCRQGALQYVPRYKKEAKAEVAVDESRRNFLAVGTAMIAGATIEAQAKKIDGGLAAIQDKEVPNREITPKPAGALSVRHLTQHCTACQLCITACPNQVLRPSQSLDHFMQPEMSFEKGYCRPECNRCSQVCPTGAIQPISVAEKSSIQIGRAVWIKANCLVETDHVSCGNCAKHCPSGAILMVPTDANNPESLKIPVVNTERCIGCGACENLCPARPLSAIYVEGNDEHREI